MTAKEIALAVENQLKQEVQKKYRQYKEGKLKSCIVKTNYFGKCLYYPGVDQETLVEATRIYNERNDNDEPWVK